jgi:hypothetical protein
MLDGCLDTLMKLTPQELAQSTPKDIQEEIEVMQDYTQAYGPDAEVDAYTAKLSQAQSLQQQ